MSALNYLVSARLEYRVACRIEFVSMAKPLVARAGQYQGSEPRPLESAKKSGRAWSPHPQHIDAKCFTPADSMPDPNTCSGRACSAILRNRWMRQATSGS